MLVLAGCLSTPLAAQSAWTLGLAATLGGGWQIEGADLGVVRRVRAGPIFGRATDVRTFLGLRFEAPLAHRERRP